MMSKFVLLVVSLSVVSATYEAEFAVFKYKYNKTYKNADEELYRYSIYVDNKNFMTEHNQLFASGQSSYFMGEGPLSDLTTEEVLAKMTGLQPRMESNSDSFTTGKYRDVLPSSVDWRTKGYVTAVKNQGNCGSCWAFSTTGALEGAHFKATGQLVSLSESNLVDCTRKYGNHGCGGGWPFKAWRYIIDNKGLDTEASYPYTPHDRQCHFHNQTVGATVSSYTNVTKGSEDDLQKAVATVGPVSVCIVVDMTFVHYKGGVYDNPKCEKTWLNHCVLAAGYGTEGGKDYWLVKNSWGTKFGEEGYIKMSRNKDNQCGIANAATYPVV